MVYLHILGSGDTQSAQSNSKGHLFESLMLSLCKHLKMEVTHSNKSENGKEIDIEGKTIVGNVPFFAECKAKESSLDSTDIQKFGFKFLTKKDESDARGLLFTLSALNPKAQEVWDNDLHRKYGDKVTCYLHHQVVDLLKEHYELIPPLVIQKQASDKYGRHCGDTQLLCVEGSNNEPSLFWAQLLMSSDSTEPKAVAIYGSKGDFVSEESTIENLLGLKPDLATEKLTCLNIEELPSTLDDISPSRTVVRVRMSSEWFDFRFPAAPEFFVGRDLQRAQLSAFIQEVRDRKTTSRGVLVLGKSGIGKSSLALKFRQELRERKTVFVPIDSRLCDDVSFLFDSVNELLFELRQIPKLIDGLERIQVKGLDSLINTLADIHDVIDMNGYLAVLFFDQFEKVFEYPEVTKALRKLFLSVNERKLSVLFGFAWKSDLWSLAEGFPHYERDDIIHESFALKRLTEFGPEEATEILKQLEIQWESKLNVQLRRQITAFCRGLPWLLKKVCAHVLEQKQSGISESELIETNLKLQDLFEADLSGLDDEERSLLRAIAPLLPATLQKLSESFEISKIDQALHRFINNRILVKITEDVGGSLANVKYDAYSDIFREFLITGNVPLGDTYYFYAYPRAAFEFFERVRERITLSLEQEMKETGKQVGSTYNLSRDLRSVGLIEVHNKVFSVTDHVTELQQAEVFSFLQNRLKQNRLVSATLAELNERDTIPLSRVADLLQELFPSVQEFKVATREHYSKTTASWLHYARLAFYDKRGKKSLHKVDNEAVFELVIDRGTPSLKGFRLPMCFRNAIINCLGTMASAEGKICFEDLMSGLSKSHQSIEKVLSDSLNLDFVYQEEQTTLYCLTPIGQAFVESPEDNRRQLFYQQCSKLDVFNQFVGYVEAAGKRGIPNKQAASLVVQEMQLDMADATIDKLGNILANWAEYAGVIARSRRLCLLQGYVPEQFKLF